VAEESGSGVVDTSLDVCGRLRLFVSSASFAGSARSFSSICSGLIRPERAECFFRKSSKRSKLLSLSSQPWEKTSNLDSSSSDSKSCLTSSTVRPSGLMNKCATESACSIGHASTISRRLMDNLRSCRVTSVPSWFVYFFIGY